MIKNPLSDFPQGGKVPPLLPPWGKDGIGVIRIKRIEKERSNRLCVRKQAFFGLYRPYIVVF